VDQGERKGKDVCPRGVDSKSVPGHSCLSFLSRSPGLLDIIAMARILYLALGAILSGISPVEGAFTLYNSTFLDVTLGEGCISALSSSIECLDYVKLFTQPTYRGSLNNDTLTDLICATGCSASLKSWFDSVAVNCEGKLLNNALPTKFGGYIWAGFNETCLKDPVTGDYCNGMCI